MIKYEQSKINHQPYVRVTSDKENYFVKIKGSSDEPTNEIMINGETTDLKFEEIYVEPVEEEINPNDEISQLEEKCETNTEEKPKNKPQMIVT